MNNETIKVSEIFYSVQGEGVNIGKPSIFIRLAGCNLRCDFCDTKYAWDESTEMTLQQIVDEIKKYPCKHIVFTGGEPLLQYGSIKEIISILNSEEYTFEIETNGTISFDVFLFDVVNISPKKQSINKELLERFSLYQPYIYFKFVIEKPEDVQFYLQLCEECEIDKEQIIFMPEGTTDEELKKKSEWLIPLCKQYGVRYSPRLQIWLYGNKRGV